MTSGASAFAALIVVVTLSACAGRPDGVLIPAATAAGPEIQTSTVDMLVATTRAPSEEPGVVFSGERGADVSVENIVVSIPPEGTREIGEVAWPNRLPGDPARDFVASSITSLDQAGARAWIDQQSSGRRQLLIFVHGFNNTYAESVFRFAQIVHDSGTTAAPVLFTWPSRASIFAYNYDRDSANYSRTALEEILRAAVDDPQVQDVTVMAHSMGSWLTMEALRQMAIRDGEIAPKLRNVILASPDVDVDVFGSQIADIGTDGPKITLFTSRDDRALEVSRRIAGGVNRLGLIDASQEPYRSQLEAAGITVLDLSALRAGDRTNHSKFAQSEEVVKLIGNRLIAGQEVSDANVSLGEQIGATTLGVAQTAGSAAGAVATAPIAIFDEEARRELAERVDETARGLGGTVQTAVGQ